MSKRNIIKKDKKLSFWIPQADFDSLSASQQSSNFPSMSGFLLHRIRARKITIMVRNRSQDDILQEISRIRKALEKIHMQSDYFENSVLEKKPENRSSANELSALIDQLNNKIDKLLNLWLP